MDFAQKIDKILTIKGIKLWNLEQMAGMNSTIAKAYDENRELRGTTETKFLEKCRINPVWWKTGTGEIFLPETTDDEFIKIHREVWNRMEIETQRDHEENIRINRRAWDQIDETMAQQRTLFQELSENYKALKKAVDELNANRRRVGDGK